MNGKLTFNRKVQAINSIVDPHESNDDSEICDTQNESELKSVGEAVIINEEEVQSYLSNSSEAQEFFVLNQETGQYQKYIYIPPTESVGKEENNTSSTRVGFEEVIKDKVDEQENVTKADIVPTPTTLIANKVISTNIGEPIKCKVGANDTKRNASESNSVIKTFAGEETGSSERPKAGKHQQSTNDLDEKIEIPTPPVNDSDEIRKIRNKGSEQGNFFGGVRHYNNIHQDKNQERLTKSSSNSPEIPKNHIKISQATQEKE